MPRRFVLLITTSLNLSVFVGAIVVAIIIHYHFDFKAIQIQDEIQRRISAAQTTSDYRSIATDLAFILPGETEIVRAALRVNRNLLLGIGALGLMNLIVVGLVVRSSQKRQ